jgi:hypothetical protein
MQREKSVTTGQNVTIFIMIRNIPQPPTFKKGELLTLNPKQYRGTSWMNVVAKVIRKKKYQIVVEIVNPANSGYPVGHTFDHWYKSWMVKYNG